VRVLPTGAATSKLGEWELALELASHESTVFVARRKGPRDFSRWVAIRYVGPFLGEDAAIGDAIVADANRASRIVHPGVLTVHEAGTALGGRYVVTDYVEGGTLAELAEAGPIPLEVLSSIALDVLAGLAAMHGTAEQDQRPKGLAHGRVSPRNIIVGLDGRARLADLGLMRLPRRAVGSGAASFHFAAPEVLRGDLPSPRADVFSVGMVLYEAIGRRHPFESATSPEQVLELLLDPLPLLSIGTSRAPTAIAAAIARAVSSEPLVRYRSADAFAEALEAAGMQRSARAVEALVRERLSPAIDARREACQAWSLGFGEGKAPPTELARAAHRARRFVRRRAPVLFAVALVLIIVGFATAIALR
jgi:serine/threonine-protein kinase